MAKTYYLSKYALSGNGSIEKCEGYDAASDGFVKLNGYVTWALFKVGRDCHLTAEAAIAAAEAMRAKSIASKKKQIAKLEKMTFTAEA